jgi:hypothetical protein
MSTISAPHVVCVDRETLSPDHISMIQSLDPWFDALDITTVVRMGMRFDESTRKITFGDNLSLVELLECVKSLSDMKMHGDSWLLDGTMSTLVQLIIESRDFSVEAIFSYFVGDSTMAQAKTGEYMGGKGITVCYV